MAARLGSRPLVISSQPWGSTKKLTPSDSTLRKPTMLAGRWLESNQSAKRVNWWAKTNPRTCIKVAASSWLPRCPRSASQALRQTLTALMASPSGQPVTPNRVASSPAAATSANRLIARPT
ncbi:hypothetical protein D3C75_1020930 [compost metagenome]